MKDIFISYSRRDTAIVDKFADKFSKAGYKYWMDVDGVESGDEFKRKIVSAIKESKVFLFFSSEASNSSSWTVKEVNVAVLLKKPIIPIKLDNAVYDDSLLFDLAGLDFIECSSDDKISSSIQKLMRSLKNKIGPGNNGGSEDEPDVKEPTDPGTLKDIDEFLASLENGKVKTESGKQGDDDETVVVPAILNDVEKAQTLDDDGEIFVAIDNSSSTPEGEVSRSGGEENADPAAHVIPTKRSAEESQFTDEEILDSVQDDKGAKKEKSGNGNEKSAAGVISNDSEKSHPNNDKPSNKKWIAIVAVALLVVTALIIGVNFYNDNKAGLAEQQKMETLTTMVHTSAEQQRIDEERKAQEEAARKADEERKAKEEAERVAKERADRIEFERIVMAKADSIAAERLVKEEAENLAKEQARKIEQERLAAEAEAQRATAIAEQQRIDADRKAQERADSIAAEQQRIAKEEAERKRREEYERSNFNINNPPPAPTPKDIKERTILDLLYFPYGCLIEKVNSNESAAKALKENFGRSETVNAFYRGLHRNESYDYTYKGVPIGLCYVDCYDDRSWYIFYFETRSQAETFESLLVEDIKNVGIPLKYDKIYGGMSNRGNSVSIFKWVYVNSPVKITKSDRCNIHNSDVVGKYIVELGVYKTKSKSER